MMAIFHYASKAKWHVSKFWHESTWRNDQKKFTAKSMHDNKTIHTVCYQQSAGFLPLITQQLVLHPIPQQSIHTFHAHNLIQNDWHLSLHINHYRSTVLISVVSTITFSDKFIPKSELVKKRFFYWMPHW